MYNLTKAEKLHYIVQNTKKIKFKNILIPKFFFFTKKNYLLNKKKFLLEINKKFRKKKIIIRSSSSDEDLKNLSNAGKYSSFSNINSSDECQILFYTEKLIKKLKHQKDQIIVQEYIDKPDLAGVLFTREVNNNSPYYVINYDKSGLTDTITSGKNHQTIKNQYVFREKIFLSKKFKHFLIEIKKLEKFLKTDRLDIEFAKKNKKWIIFQCRVLPQKNKSINYDEKVEIALNNLFKKIKKLKKENPSLLGKTTFFSNMADWNPAEMIGDKPKALGMSLYSTLITDSIWSVQRKKYGYKDVSPNVLMVNLAGSPYIDLRTDINSFLPSNIQNAFGEKLVNSILTFFKKNSTLHDKVEFDIIPTCYDFNIKNFKSILNLSKVDKNIYIKSLKILTNKILHKKILNEELKKINYLDKQIKKIQSLKLHPIEKIFFLINYCKKYGTLPFAGIARLSFVCTKILRSLVFMGLIKDDDAQMFYNNIDTITCKLNRDLLNINNKHLKKKFIIKYGHLRPNTYSINSLNYKEGFNKYFSENINIKSKKKNKLKLFKPISLNYKKLDKVFNSNKINITGRKFLNLFSECVKNREYAKFIFTKSINEVFNNLKILSKEIKIDIKDLENININTILSSYNNLEVLKLRNILKNEIRKNKLNYRVLEKIVLPDVIKSNNEIYNFELPQSKGNFVTMKNVSGNIYYIKNNNIGYNLANKVICIENADPGFDYIFSKKIKGLVTKYGGANSHMTIRCLEQGIPAAIGIGAKQFSNVISSKVVELNCKQKILKILL